MKRAPLVLVTAGPTREKIDPVRFVSNYSTGTFGYAIAEEARRRGYRVVLVSGPVSIEPPSGVRTISVESALDMLKVVRKWSPKAGYIFMAAAVSDWRVRKIAGAKIKRTQGKGSRILELVENPDVLKSVKRPKACRVIGFALETEDLLRNAALKMKEKNMDMIVANRLTKSRNLFGDKVLDIAILDRSGRRASYSKGTKKALAKIILDKVFDFNIK